MEPLYPELQPFDRSSAMAGFVLAATLHADKAPPIQQLAEPLRQSVAEGMRAFRALEPHLRRAYLHHITDQLRPAVRTEPADRRVRALLATEVPREVGRRWLDDAAAPRRGFRPTSELRRLLVMISSDPTR